MSLFQGVKLGTAGVQAETGLEVARQLGLGAEAYAQGTRETGAGTLGAALGLRWRF